jgi:hypothetical protein
MNTWSESKRQELVIEPIRVEFNSPINLDFHRNLSALGFSLTDCNYDFLGTSVKDAILSYSSRRNTKSYNRESLTASRVEAIMSREVIDGETVPDIAVSGRLVATRDGNGVISSIVLCSGNIEMVLDLKWIERVFKDVNLFYKVNSVKVGGKQVRVYVLRYKVEDKGWEVRNWAMPILADLDEDEESWKKRWKSQLRDRNKFSVVKSDLAAPNILGLPDERGITLSF